MTGLIKHPEFGVIRTEIIKGEPWFVAKDVCAVLGLKNQHDSGVRGLDEDEKGWYKIPTPGGSQEMVTVSESGLYALIMRSRVPAAKQFRKWVTSEVLPSIRKQGYYIHPEFADKQELRRLNKEMYRALSQYLTHDDLKKISKKFGLSPYSVRAVASGQTINNAIMQECQRLALANKQKEKDAYHPENVRRMLKELTK